MEALHTVFKKGAVGEVTTTEATVPPILARACTLFPGTVSQGSLSSGALCTIHSNSRFALFIAASSGESS